MPAGVLVLQLDPEAPPGLVTALAEDAGVELQVRENVAHDEMLAAAGLIVLGSVAVPSPADATVALLAGCMRSGLPVLAAGAGVLPLALALGGAIHPDRSHEFGYVDLVPTALAAEDPVLRGLGAGLPVMEWHDEAIELPGSAEILAHCVRGRVQAFRHAGAVYGLRFHPGSTIEIVRRWAALRGAAANNPAVPVRIGAEIVRHQERTERFGASVVAAWLALVRARNAATISGTSLDRS